ncbi:MAG: glycosyltransferase family 2 protein [Acidobacteriota bacterium]|jgi:N-acetylglucosaminyl-diphospho-decaprenol L-rhamnosyltransferase|nr:MAG: glycosyltransferase family 2 protein [Acidobacteriota bacterium]
MTFDIVIVNYNNRDDLAACLESLTAARPQRLARVIVVDNASTDGSAEYVAAHRPDVELIRQDHNSGFAAANNVGIRRATAPLVLLLNSDTIVPAGALDGLVERLEATDATAAGPRLVDGEGLPEVSFGPMLSPWGEALQRLRVRLAARRSPLARRYIARLTGRERFVDWVSGGCLLVRRQAALDAGLLDERYFLYEEDVDFCAALRARGGRILFTPRVTVVHLRGRSVRRAGPPSTFHYDRSHVAFYEKHLPGWAPLLRWWLKVRGRSVR